MDSSTATLSKYSNCFNCLIWVVITETLNPIHWSFVVRRTCIVAMSAPFNRTFGTSFCLLIKVIRREMLLYAIQQVGYS